jgi:hypothetical protein
MMIRVPAFAELPMDHAGEARQREIALRRGGRQKIEIRDGHTGSFDGVPDGQRRHLGVGEQRALVAIDRKCRVRMPFCLRTLWRARDALPAIFPRKSSVDSLSTGGPGRNLPSDVM